MTEQTCEQCGATCRYSHDQEHADLRVGCYHREWKLCPGCAEALKEAIQEWRGEATEA